jgi:hypothetical protein
MLNNSAWGRTTVTLKVKEIYSHDTQVQGTGKPSRKCFITKKYYIYFTIDKRHIKSGGPNRDSHKTVDQLAKVL